MKHPIFRGFLIAAALIGLLVSLIFIYKTMKMYQPVPEVVMFDKEKTINIEGFITQDNINPFNSKVLADMKQHTRTLIDQVRDGAEVITIRINSGGGLLEAGFGFVTVMRAARFMGVKLTCVVDGIAMSMALIIFSECTTRYATFGSKVMWHSLAHGYAGKMNEQIASKLLQAILVKNEQIWANTRIHFWPSYFIEHFVKETHIDVTEIEQESFWYLRVIKKLELQ